jgi:hypothetical protein
LAYLKVRQERHEILRLKGFIKNLVTLETQSLYKETQKYSKFFRSDKGNLSKYRIGLQGFPVEVTCVQFFGPSVNDNSPPNLDIFLQCRDSGFILKVFDLSAPRWIQGVTLKQMKDFLFEEVREPEKEEWRFEVWLKSNS